MTERIMNMGLNAIEIKEMNLIEVSGSNEKLMELKDTLDNEGYSNDTAAMEMMFGVRPPEADEVTKILITTFGDKDGYLLVA